MQSGDAATESLLPEGIVIFYNNEQGIKIQSFEIGSLSYCTIIFMLDTLFQNTFVHVNVLNLYLSKSKDAIYEFVGKATSLQWMKKIPLLSLL